MKDSNSASCVRKISTFRYWSGTSAIVVALSTVLLAACTHQPTIAVNAGFGPNPVLPPPTSKLIPTLNIAPAIGWPSGKTPHAAEGTRVAAFAA